MKWQLVICIFRELAPTASMGAFFHLAPLQNEWPTPAIQYADGLEWGKKIVFKLVGAQRTLVEADGTARTYCFVCRALSWTSHSRPFVYP